MKKILQSPAIKSIIERLKNKGTVLALVSGFITILIQLGFKVDSDKVMTIVQTLCSISIALGVLNDPTTGTKGYIPGISDKLVKGKEGQE